MKGSSFGRSDQPLRRRAREDLVRGFMRARAAAAPVRAIRPARKRKTAPAQ